jgi:hypothetical protein
LSRRGVDSALEIAACPYCETRVTKAGRYCLACGKNLEAYAARVETLQAGLLVLLAVAALVFSFARV